MSCRSWDNRSHLLCGLLGRVARWCQLATGGAVGDVRADLRDGLLNIRFAYDVVPVEYGSRFVTGNGHGYPLRYVRPNHVADSTAAKVVDQNGDARLSRGIRPRLSEIADRLAIVVKNKEAIEATVA